jgi:hypothetical protein
MALLTDEQVAHYHDHGYVFPDYRLSEDTLEKIRADHERLLREHPEHPEFRDNCSALLRFDFRFLNYARNPDILDMVEHPRQWLHALHPRLAQGQAPDAAPAQR